MKIKKTTEGWELIPLTNVEADHLDWLVRAFQAASQPRQVEQPVLAALDVKSSVRAKINGLPVKICPGSRIETNPANVRYFSAEAQTSLGVDNVLSDAHPAAGTIKSRSSESMNPLR